MECYDNGHALITTSFYDVYITIRECMCVARIHYTRTLLCIMYSCV